ncbi:MAG: SDR family oxidoreductase [Verrucomicrobiota bacterium]
MKCLITGATGFLGRRVAEVFKTEFEVVGHGFTQTGVEIHCNLKEPDEIRRMLDEQTPDVVINCAAFRDPDFCEDHPEDARRLNTRGVEVLAEALPADRRLIQVSTDYVFGGGNPPYGPDDATFPINVYGETKRDGEAAALNHPNGLALRIPLLVGAGPTWETSGFIFKTAELIEAGTAAELDDVGTRFPTWINDVAEALLFLVQRDATGIYHCSSSTPSTKYKLAVELAGLMNRSAEHLRASQDPVSRAIRPSNTQLDTSKLKALGFDRIHPFVEVAEKVLKSFGIV